MSNTSEVQEIYTTKAGLYHRVFFQILKYDKAVQSFFQKEKYLRSKLRVLDAGCGSGLITKILLALAKENKLSGITFDAFDLTENMLNIFNRWVVKKDLKNIEIKQANVLRLNELPKRWKDYDLIVSSAMLEYLSKKNIAIALAELRNLLKKDGTIIILITKRNFVTYWLVKRWWKARTYKNKEIEQIFFKAGFHNIKLKLFPRPYNYLNRGVLIIEANK
ncbi:class I SAM-dependent methyltransferase [Candidatus Woesearchaeota archaeon]|nr:class I SAM-dependent methyltransferase [Candidatus Woesearchaeota archaeon]